MKTLAIMQPYFLPYIGYIQLLRGVDRFVILDDVNYINRGWVNRNRLLLHGAAYTFTLPLQNASQNRLICDIELLDSMEWRKNIMCTIQHAYTKAPVFEEVWPLMESIFEYPTIQLDKFLLHSLRKVVEYLNLNIQIVKSARRYNNAHLRGQDRIIDICRQEGASRYVNAIGGRSLYRPECFAAYGIELTFLQSRPVIYRQKSETFIPWLSIMDVLMFNTKEQTLGMLQEFDLI